MVTPAGGFAPDGGETRSDITLAQFHALVESAPGAFLVLRPDTFEIVAVTQAYADATVTTCEALLHRRLFDAFPDDPSESAADGSDTLRRSLERVLATRQPDHMAVQRYPIPLPPEAGGGFEERFWSPMNSPVLGADGRVDFIIHRVEDVTEYMRTRESDDPLTARLARLESDIVARGRDLQRANEQLRLAHDRVQATFDSTAFGIVMLAPEGAVVMANRAACEWLGRAHADLLNEPFAQLVHPDDAAELRGLLDAVAASERRAVELRLVPAADRERWVRASVTTVLDAASQLSHVLLVLEDIDSERASEERFRLLSRATNDAIWDWNLRTDALWWNEGYEVLFGRRRTDVSPTITSWTDYIHPDDLERVTRNIHAVIDSGRAAFVEEYRFARADGTYAWVIDRGHVIRDSDGAPIRMIGGMTDFTERVRSEERVAEQAALIDEASDAIIVRDLDHRITLWNRGAVSLHGWSAEEAIGRHMGDLLYRSKELFERATADVRARGSWSGELDELTKDGRVRTVFGRWTLMRDREGRPRSILAIQADVTELRMAERQMLRSQRLQSIGTLAGGIAHDLNNVLTPIIMATEFLRMDEVDEGRLETLAIIVSSARRGADMVQQVLTFARGAEGQRVGVSVAEVVGDVVKIASETFERSIRIHSEIAPDLPLVQGAPTQLHQVLLNLFVNARDAMAAGGDLRVSVAETTIDPLSSTLPPEAVAGQFLVISVEDTGVGMTKEVLDRLFEPFFSTKELGRGTGLGLSTSQAIVRGHGGFVRVSSELGRGSRFEVYLPAFHGVVEVPEQQPAAALPRGHGELILIVDDEPAVRRVAQKTLEAFGYRVIVAVDGADGIAQFGARRAEIDLVLTDLMMPVMDGPAMVELLLPLKPGIRIVAASGLHSSRWLGRAAEVGVKHFLAKPYTAEQLLVTLRDALAMPETE